MDYNQPGQDGEEPEDHWECGRVVRPGMEVEGREEDEEQGKEEWKQSWRKMSSKSRGRVRGMVFELELPRVEGSPANSPEKPNNVARSNSSASRTYRPRSRVFPQFGGSAPDVPPRSFGATGTDARTRARADSVASSSSAASIDSADGLFDAGTSYKKAQDKDSSFELTSPEVGKDSPAFQSTDAFSGAAGSTDQAEADGDEPAVIYQLTRNEDGTARVVGETQRPQLNAQSTVTRGAGARMITRQLSSWAPDDVEEEQEDEGTVVRRTRSERIDNSGGSKLGELFGLTITSDATGQASALSVPDADIVAAKIGDGRGSMVLVKRSQLQTLEARMAKIESQLVALSSSGSISNEEAYPSPTMIHDWMKASLKSSLVEADDQQSTMPASTDSAEGKGAGGQIWTESPTWAQLGGWMAAASFGIGLVAGEVIVGRLTGWRRR